jgi:hypothetical protein
MKLPETSFRKVDGESGWGMRKTAVEGEISGKNDPQKLEAGKPVSGVEEFRKPTARWTLNRV